MLTMTKWPRPSYKYRTIRTLEVTQKMMEALDNPHTKLPNVIHVAGTNGKGSTVAFLKAILEKSSYRVHTYTSPHLVYFNERIYLAGEYIDDNYLTNLLEKCRLVCESLNIEPTFFEGTTAAAFLAFSEIQADFLILETGLGGEVDPTNIIPSNLASIITPIAYDHMHLLGSTLDMIAKEKAGIIKPCRPCFVSLQTDEAFNAIMNRCQELNSPLIGFGYDYGINKTDNGFMYQDQHNTWEFPLPSLVGDHQIINAGCVISCLSNLNIPNVTYDSIKEGITNTKWNGRLQKITNGKYHKMIKDSNCELWIDGAHNPHGAQALATWVEDYAKKPVNLILGMTKNRNVPAFLNSFKGLIEHIYLVEVEDEALAATTEYLYNGAIEAGFNATECESIANAINIILQKYQEGTILITGSLYLNSDVLYN